MPANVNRKANVQKMAHVSLFVFLLRNWRPVIAHCDGPNRRTACPATFVDLLLERALHYLQKRNLPVVSIRLFQFFQVCFELFNVLPVTDSYRNPHKKGNEGRQSENPNHDFLP